MRNFAIVCSLWLISCAVNSPTVADDWPGWRGQGSGVSNENHIPTIWGANKNIRWKTRIDGDGISSPIVWGNRVLVTTAVERSTFVSKQAVVVIGVALLAIVLFAAVLLRRRGREPQSDQTSSGWWRYAFLLDRSGTILALILFLLSLALMLTVDALIIPGNLSRSWRVTGASGMLGFLAAVGFLPVHSRYRLIAALVMVVAAVFYHLAAPRGYHEAIPFYQLLVASGPLCLAAAWCVFLFLMSRRRSQSPQILAQASSWGLVGWLSLLALVVLPIGFVNYASPLVGLVREVVCLDRDSGEIVWRQGAFTAPAHKKYPTNSYATPTPATDGACVVAYFGVGLVCLDMEGNVQWTRMEPKYTSYLRYGAGASPIIYEDVVIYAFMAEWPGRLSAESDNKSYERNSHLTALDKQTGKVLWQVRPPGAHDSYNTPLLVRIGDRPALLFTTYGYCVAYDVRDGAAIWSCKVPIEQCVPSIVSDETTAYVIGGTHGLRGGVAVQLVGEGDITDSNVVWEVHRGIPECCSPVLYDRLIYMVTDGGVATCLDADTGKQVWKNRVGGNYQAALVAGDGKIYFTAVNGRTTVVRAGRRFAILARNSLGENVMASPAISGGKLFIRDKQHVFCIEDRSPPSIQQREASSID